MKSRIATYGTRQAVAVLHSYAKLKRRRLSISLVPLAELEEAVERVAPDMNSRQVAMTIWAYGALGMPGQNLVCEMAFGTRHKILFAR